LLWPTPAGDYTEVDAAKQTLDSGDFLADHSEQASRIAIDRWKR
jgi:hypothetical protein